MVQKYFDDIELGETSTSRARTITETDIVNFCAFTGDWYPLHSDLEYAKSSMFGQRIAHGMLVLSVASGLSPLEPGVIVAFYGMDRVRFANPTFIGDTIHVESEVIEKEEKDEKTGVLTVKQDVVKQDGLVAASSVLKILLMRKPPTAKR
jgi:acyl dehydratase